MFGLSCPNADDKKFSEIAKANGTTLNFMHIKN